MEYSVKQVVKIKYLENGEVREDTGMIVARTYEADPKYDVLTDHGLHVQYLKASQLSV
tara:strand:- start:2068 stop:2241 length:174 start_codon:yes stop_codon:yes gene_type:complete